MSSITLSVGSRTMIQAKATADDYSPSAVASKTITVYSGTVATPVIVDGKDGTFTITCGTAGATIIYTDDGTTPSRTNGETYPDEAVTSEVGLTINAFAYKDLSLDSAAATPVELTEVTFEDETIAYLAAMTDDGDSTYQAWIDGLVKALKGSGTSPYTAHDGVNLLTKLDGLWLFCNKADSGDAVPASFVNLKAPTGTKAAKVGTPTYTTYGGWNGAGSHAIDLGLVLTGLSNYSINNGTIVAYADWDDVALGSPYPALLGVVGENSQASFLSPTANLGVRGGRGGLNNTASPNSTSAIAEKGMLAVARESASDILFYGNGSKVGNTQSSTASAIPTTYTLWAGAINNKTNIAQAINCPILFVAVGALSAAEHANLYSDIDTWLANSPAGDKSL